MTLRRRHLAAAATGLTALAGTASAEDLATALRPLSGRFAASTEDVAGRDLLALGEAAEAIRADAARPFQRNILDHGPVILALPTASGGRMILHRPELTPLEAPPVPAVFRLLTALNAGTLALAPLLAPHLGNPGNLAWRAPLRDHRTRMASALDTLDAAGMTEDWRINSRDMLRNAIAFADAMLAKQVVTAEDLGTFGALQRPFLMNAISWAAQTQVAHWMTVLDTWRGMLGDDLKAAYGVVGTSHTARQNNVLFSLLAQYFGADSVNDRLLLVEAPDAALTPETLLAVLTRTLGDRVTGAAFFGDGRAMDYELLGGDARAAILYQADRRGMIPVLPPVVPFGSAQWPMLVTQGPGATMLSELP